MPSKPLKAMTRTKDLKAGHFMFEFNTPGVGYIMKEAGCDFLVFDTEHSGYGIDTVKNVMAYMRTAAMPTVVRVPSKDYHDIARTLDAGADGVMLPMVSTVDEANAIIDSVKYPPRGGRGVILRSAHDHYTSGPTLDKLEQANRETVIFAQIETADGVKNAEKIAALDDIDCLWVGHFDLSCSLGIPGQFDDKKFTDAIAEVVRACQATDTSLGRLVPEINGAIALYEQGFDFIAYHADAWAWGDAVKQGIDAIRAGVTSPRDR
jgi:2-dehydro-3-deoxyglucarate aldolase/4-hydroxy-2-oxoheptanedioate aldolase